ncbi:RAMP superfamily CRISPR-associated protein [Rhodovulum sp. DZ06]|uniref:RAMP superfamily CRISPR-associated protein n=1 Tax=Rhodovulum sp. DZ06 TaxID=3425126 RepID=UPI003D326963
MTNGRIIRSDIALKLEVVTPLHIGSGASRVIEKDGETGELRLVQRGEGGRPYIPGSTLKGVLRAHYDGPETAAIFGEIGAYDTDADAARGRMGVLLCRGAQFHAPGPVDGHSTADAETGIFPHSRTAIDPGRGTALANRLFHMELIAPGTVFDWTLRLEDPGGVDALKEPLLDALSRWGGAHGMQIGADGASGLGAVRISAAPEVTDWVVDPGTGGLKRAQAARAQWTPREADDDVVELTLECEGPFLTRDPSHVRGKDLSDEEQEKDPHIKALHLANKPLITGQAVSGALRHAYAWRRKLYKDDLPGADEIFGSVEAKALLTVQVIDVTAKAEALATSVRIDRFTGGAIDNALFTVQADVGVAMRLRLKLDARRAGPEADRARDEIVEALKSEGLSLGHGAGKGFGWFKVGAAA